MAHETRKQASQPRRSRDVQGSTAKPERTELPDDGIPVRATARGFYGGNPIPLGREFTISSMTLFSKKWMELDEGAAKTKKAPADEGAAKTKDDKVPNPDDPLGAGQ